MIELSKEEFQKLKRGDHEVFNRFYTAYSEVVYNYLLTKTKGDEDAAGDLFCEINCAIFISVKNLVSKDNLSGWIMTIAHRKYCNYIRKTVKNQNLIKNLIEYYKVKENGWNRELNNEQKYVLFNSAFKNLKERYREIIGLKYIKGKSIKETAKILNITEIAVGGLLFRAKEKLKKEVQKLLKYF